MVIITGVSRGLGEAIAKKYLDEGFKVMGIGRSHSILHPNFSFKKCDLSDLTEVENLDFELFTSRVTLINNAGIIGEIGRVSEHNSSDMNKVLTVNVSAPVLLTQKVYSKVLEKDKFSLVNISSGAGKNAIPSWSSYCTSKAALNMFSEVFKKEEHELGRNIKVLAVSPGVIDTGMQEEIRSAKSESFSAREKFIQLKKNQELFSPEEAALRLFYLVEKTNQNEIYADLRQLNVQ